MTISNPGIQPRNRLLGNHTVKIKPAVIAQIPIIFNLPSLSIRKPARFEPQKHPKNMLIIKIPIFKLTSPSRAPPSVFRETKKKPKSVLNK